MTWQGEVAHIMRKDARELRWLIVGYMAVVLAATANALGWFSRQSYEGGMLLVVGAGILLLASIVQADSPTRPDAFWASHPHRPLAVMFAKLLLGVIVIAMPALAGQYVALSVLAPTGSAVVRLLIAAAFTYGVWLLVTLVISAITPDIRTFLLLMIATPIALTVGASMLWPKLPSISTIARSGLGAAAFVACLTFVAVLYRTRDARRRTWIVAVVLVASTACTIMVPDRAITRVADHLNSPAQTTPFHFETGDVGHTKGGNAILNVRAVVDSAPHSERIEFTPTVATVELIDGKRFSVSIHYGTMLLTEPEVALGDGISLLTPDDERRGVNTFALQLPAERSSLATLDVARVTIEGNIVSSVPTIVGSMALARGASVVRPGMRVEVNDVRTPPNTRVELHVRAVTNDGGTLTSGIYGRSTLDAVLVDESNRTAHLLFSFGSQETSGAMVLPASGVRNEVIQFGVAPAGTAEARQDLAPASSETRGLPDSAPPTTDVGWLRTHRLTMVQWVKHGEYPVRVTARPRAASLGALPSPRLALARAR